MGRHLDSLYTPTAAPKAAPNPAPIEKPKRKKPQIKPQGVYLTETELAYIQDIANTYGESRHGVMQYAVKELIRQWKRGKKPRTNILGKLDK